MASQAAQAAEKLRPEGRGVMARRARHAAPAALAPAHTGRPLGAGHERRFDAVPYPHTFVIPAEAGIQTPHLDPARVMRLLAARLYETG